MKKTKISNFSKMDESFDMLTIKWNDFELDPDSTIKEGTFGRVFNCIYQEQKAKIKIFKILKRDNDKSSYIREALFPNLISHPAIVKPLGHSLYIDPDVLKKINSPVKELFESSEAFLITEKKEGDTLREYHQKYIHKKTLTDITDAICQLFCIARVLMTLNERGIYHGDVSDNNIMVNGKNAWLIDFGNAESGEKKRIGGTYFDKNNENKFSDCYAFGLMVTRLYENYLAFQIPKNTKMSTICEWLQNNQLFKKEIYEVDEFNTFRDKYIVKENKERSDGATFSMFSLNNLIKLPYFKEIQYNLYKMANLGNGHALLILSHMWANGFFARNDYYQAIFFALEAKRIKFPSSDEFVSDYAYKLGIELPKGKFDVKEVYQLVNQKLIEDAKRGNWIAQVRLYFIRKQQGKNDELTMKLEKVLSIHEIPENELKSEENLARIKYNEIDAIGNDTKHSNILHPTTNNNGTTQEFCTNDLDCNNSESRGSELEEDRYYSDRSSSYL
ncbi:CAMK family protein kinase family [Trichomonas vaginalis G3]|nr:CAMK family protein kinase family [Trichomonas vaginalis G3]KAI5522331.1 CAMK family protein kinase family [Trichomonas vaginalis G3]